MFKGTKGQSKIWAPKARIEGAEAPKARVEGTERRRRGSKGQKRRGLEDETKIARRRRGPKGTKLKFSTEALVFLVG